MKAISKYKAGRDAVNEVITSDLRALLFWASIGVAKSKSGSYRDILNIMESYADHLKFKLPYKPEFDAMAKAKRQ